MNNDIKTIEKQESKFRGNINFFKDDANRLIRNSIDYCRDFYHVPNSVWGTDKNPIYELKKIGFSGFSIKQKQLIYFLHSWFKNGKVCYCKYSVIAKKLDMPYERVRKTVKILHDNEIILKINFKTGQTKGGHQVLLLPNAPNLSEKAFNYYQTHGLVETTIQQSKNILLYLPPHTCPHILAPSANKDKYIESLHKNLILQGGIISTIDLKTIYTNNSLKLKTSFKLDSKRSHAVTLNDSSKLEEKKPMRLNLKRKETFDSETKTFESSKTNFLPTSEANAKNLRAKFKRGKKHFDLSEDTITDMDKTLGEIYNQPCNQRKIPTKILNKLNYIITNKFGGQYNVESLFKNIKNLESVAGMLENALLFKTFDLIKHNVETIDYINTVKIIHHFNSKKETNIKFKGMRADKNTQEFKKVQLIVTHLLLRGYTSKTIMSAIDRAAKYSQYSKLRYCQQIGLLHLLVNPKNEEQIKVFMDEEDDGAIYSSLNAVNTKYKGMQAEWKEIYMNMFPYDEDGEKYYKRNKSGLMKFAENILETAQNKNYDLCGRYFTKENSYGEPAIFQEYITFLQDKFGKEDSVITMKYIVDFSNWSDFINDKMHDELELYDFFRPIYVPQNTNKDS